MNCIICGNQYTKQWGKGYCSGSCRMKEVNSRPEVRKKFSEAKIRNPVRFWRGKELPKSVRERISESVKKRWDEGRYRMRNGNFFKGQIPWNKKENTPLKERLRFSPQMKEWKKSVFRRDNYICQKCGRKGGVLNADHIIPFYKIVDDGNWELLWSISNGRTLCID